MKSPNILFIMADQLAARGTVFENAYSPNPICSSSRSSSSPPIMARCWASAACGSS